MGTACIKKEQSQSNESQIVNMLNHNQIDSALEKINSELNISKTDELLYLKASTLSMKAGVDIYALFPLLKVKIFDVAISQWSQNREFQKKADAQKTTIGVSEQDLEEQNKTRDQKEYVPLKKNQLDFTIIGMWSHSGYGINQTDSCTIQLNVTTKLPSPEDYFWTTVTLNSQDICEDISFARVKPENLEVTPAMDAAIRKTISDSHRNSWHRRKEKEASTENYVKMLGSFWTMVDMIPMISKIPKVSSSGFKNLEEAQEILSQVKTNRPDKRDELGEKSRKQIMMISSLKIVAHVQNAFDLSHVKNPLDFFCHSNDKAAEELIECEKDALYLLNAIDDPEIIKKNKTLFDEIKSQYETIVQNEEDHPEYKDHRIMKLRAALEGYRATNCVE